MRTSIPFLCCTTLILTSLELISLSADGAESTSPQQLEQIRKNITTLKQTLGSDKKQLQQYQGELKQTEKKIARLSRKQRQTKTELGKQHQAQQKLISETKELRLRLNHQQQNLSKQIRAGYSAGQQQALKMLLNQTNPGAAGRTITYYGYFTRAQIKSAEETALNIKQLSNAEKRLEQSRRQLEKLQTSQQQQTKELQQQQSQRKILLSKLNSEISSKEQQLNILLENEKTLSKLLRDLEPRTPATPKDFSNLGELKGKLNWPTKGRIQNRYGQPRNQGRLKWQGITISGKDGQDIRAIAPGRIIFADWIRGYGLMLIVDHGNNYMSLYGHNQSLYKDVGDIVTSKEVIAALGNSGGSNTTSLYFEMRHKGKPINPETWCR